VTNAAAVAALEQANAELTRFFNQAWSDRDCDRLLTCLADDVRYMVYEGGPVHTGPAAVDQAVRRFMRKFSRIEFRILRLQVMGSVVIHERTEDYYAPSGERDTHFHVVGLLVIKNERIVLWRDYSMPGAEQIVGPLCTKKE
jgi:limonene-1,2-epoxide hydrolase